MNIQQLEAFIWIVRLGSFGAAADKLGTTQPAISARIKALEDGLGSTLFSRNGKSLVLSEQARTLVPLAENVLNGVARIFKEVAASSSLAGIVRIGMGEIVALSWFPQFLVKLNATYPSVQIQISMDVSRRLNQMIDAGELDLALVVTRSSTNLIAHSLGSLPLQWMASSALIPPGTTLSGAELARFPIYTFLKTTSYYDQAIDWFRTRGVYPDVIHSCNNLGVIIKLVSLGCGVALIPPMLVQRELESGSLQIVAAAETERTEFFVVRHKDVNDATILRIAELAIETTMFDDPNKA